jgi:hypothetical protein
MSSDESAMFSREELPIHYYPGAREFKLRVHRLSIEGESEGFAALELETNGSPQSFELDRPVLWYSTYRAHPVAPKFLLESLSCHDTT